MWRIDIRERGKLHSDLMIENWIECFWYYVYMTSDNLIDLTGKTFGFWTVIRRSDSLSNAHRSSVWICRCVCGIEKEVSSGSLRQGTSKSCGCYKRNRKMRDLTGSSFGRWFVESFDEYRASSSGRSFRYWNCKCSCGRKRSVKEGSLIAGRSQSCGCLHREVISRERLGDREDLVGRRFGQWLVIEESAKRRYPGGGSSRMWLCQCECGTTSVVASSMLKQGISRSCGCLHRSNLEKDVEDYLISRSLQFEKEVSFDDLVSDLGRPLKFDFVVTHQELTIAIECQCEQHYRPIPHFGGESAFERLGIRDSMKKSYCEKKGFHLIEVHYSRTSYEKVEAYMDEVLNQVIAWRRTISRRMCDEK